jgi:Flp pilus assembly protein TadB
MLKELLARFSDRRYSVEHKAFYDGAHGNDPKPEMDRINAQYDEKIAKFNQESAERARKHEAVIDHTRNLLPQAEQEVDNVERRLNGEKPQWLMPVIVAMAALFMAVAEIILLAPAMDALGVSNPVAQFISAAGIVLLSSVVYHLTWDALSSERATPGKKRAFIAISTVFTLFLILWGIMRGYQVAFAAKLAKSHLDEFLSAHPFLASAFFIFLTTMVPIGIATAAHFAFSHLRNWYESKTAHGKLDRLNKARVGAQKQLEAEHDRREHGIRQLVHEGTQCRAAYRNFHELGGRQKALQEPVGLVYLKSAGMALAIVGLLFWAPPILMACAALAAGITAFIYFRRRREHPKPNEYFQTQQVNFAPRLRNITPEKEPLTIEATTTPNKKKRGLLQ